MTCLEARPMMLDALYGELDPSDTSRLTAHLDRCPSCRTHLEGLRSLLGTLDRWTPPLPATGMASRALGRVAPVPEVSPRLRRRSGPPREESRSGRRASGARPWSGILRPVRAGPVGAALTAAAVAAAVIAWMPVTTVVDLCDRWIHASLGRFFFVLILTVVAAAYSAVPLLTGRLLWATDGRGHRIGERATTFALYAALTGPVVYAQCLPLPGGIGGLWGTGAVLGAALAGLASTRWARRRPGPDYGPAT